MNEQLKSVSDLAKALGISKQALYQRLRSDSQLKSQLQPYEVKQGKHVYYTPEAEKRLRLLETLSEGAGVKKVKSTDSKVNSKVKSTKSQVDSLRTQLEMAERLIASLESDKEFMKSQIIEKDKQIDRLTTALQAAQALHGMEHKQQTIDVVASAPAEVKRSERQPERGRNPERRQPSRSRSGITETLRDVLRIIRKK